MGGGGGPSSDYVSPRSLGDAARIEYRPWELESVPFVVTCGVISVVVVAVAAVADSAVSWHFRWPGGLWRPLLGLSEYAQPRGDARIEYRPWELESVLFVVTCGVISAVVVVVAAVADSAVSWHFRWPGGLWRPLLGLSEYAQPRW